MSKNFEINKNDIDMIIKACKENGIILDPNVKSDKFLLLDDDGNEFYIDKGYNIFNNDYTQSFYNNISISIITDTAKYKNYMPGKKTKYNPMNTEYYNNNKFHCGYISLNHVA